MANPKCYPKIKGCDDVIAKDERFKGLSEGAIANLRALYDEYRSQDGKPDYLAQYEDQDIPQEVVKELADVLYKFRTELKNKQGSKILRKVSSSTNTAAAFVSVARAFSPAVLREMVEFVANLYQVTANNIAQEHNKRYPNRKITRLDVIKGFKSKSGKTLYGESYIFDQLYNTISNAFINSTEQSPIKSEDLWNVLLAWGPVCMLARNIIGSRERLNMGAFHDFAYNKEEGITGTELESSIEDMMADSYDIEESTKESWQEDKNKAPMLSRVLDVVKRELATIVDINANQRETTLPFNKRLALDDAHSFLSIALTTVPNETEMVKILEKYDKEYQREFAAVQAAKQRKAAGNENVFIPEVSLSSMIGHHLVEAFKRDTSLKTAFFVSYHTGFTPFSKMMQVVRKGVFAIKDFYRSIINKDAFRPKDQIRAYIRSAGFSSNSLFKREEDGTLVFTENALEQVKGIINEFSSYALEEDSKETSDAPGIFKGRKAYKMAPIFTALKSPELVFRNNALALISQSLQSIGLNVTVEDVSRLHSLGRLNAQLLNRIAALYSQLESLIEETQDIEQFAISYTDLIDQEDGYSRDLEELAVDIYEMIGNTKFEARALVLDKNGNKSSVSSLQAPCYFTDFMDTLLFYYNRIEQAEDQQELEEYRRKAMDFIRSKFAGTFILAQDDSTVNPILSEIIESIHGHSDFLSNFRHERFAEMDIEGKEQRAENLSDVDVVLNLFHGFYGPYVKGAKTGMFPLFILGDSNVHRYMSAPIKSNEEVIEAMMAMVLKEEELAKELKAANEYLSENHYGTIAGTDKLEQRSFIAKIKELRDQYLATESSEEALRKAVTKVLENTYNEFRDQWRSLGNNEKNKDGLDMSSGSGFMYFGTNSSKQANVTTEEQSRQALRAFVYNYALNTASQLQLMTISTMYYKSLEELQKRYKEIHASGSALNVEAENPYAQPNAEGKRPPIFVDKEGHYYPYERAAYFDDILINSKLNDPDFAKVVESVLGKNSDNYAKYLENTLTDGQSYRSIHSYRKIAIAQGQWSENQEKWYQKLLEFKASNPDGLTLEQIKELDSYGIVFQPQKPYLFTIERFSFNDGSENHVVPIPVQHKCAEVILIPELLPKGSNLRFMAEAMEEQNIDVICSTEVVKVGGFGATSIAYKTNDQNLYVDKDGNVIPSKDGKTTGITRKDQTKNPNFGKLAIALHDNKGAGIKEAISKGLVHELDLSTYYRQQNVPAHVNDPRAMGTQMRKMFFTAIKRDGDYSAYFPGLTDKEGRTNVRLFSGQESVDVGPKSKNGGSNVCKFYNGLIVQNIIEAFENLVDKLASNEQLAPILQQMSLNNSRNTIYDIINYAIAIEQGQDSDEKIRNFLVPLCDPTTSTETIATLISMFRQEVNKQVMCGGSAVQASAFGISEVVHDDAVSSEYKDANTPDDGNLKCVCEYDEKGNPVNVLHAECEMPFDLYYTDENGKKVVLDYDDYCNEDGSLKLTEDGKIKLDVEFPGMRDLVAYRIPTERAYSALNLKVKKFTRKTNGGTIKVPSAFTTIAGFDFDIDKLYFLRKEFVYESKEMSVEDNKKVWDAVFSKNASIAQKLEDIRTEKEGENSTTPLNSFRDDLDLTEFGFDENTTLQDLYNQKARELGLTRGLIEYQYDKAIDENPRVARNNELLRLVQQRLQDKETLPARYTPGGFAPHKLSAKKMRILFRQTGSISLEKLDELAKTEEEYRVDYSILNPWTFVAYNKQNQAASELIGIFANQNTNHIFSSIAHRIEIVNGISFAGKGPLSDLLHSETDTEATTAGFLAASVDAVKDPVLNFMNLNSLTANTGALLARIGFDTDDIALLFNQPIIREICDMYFNNHMSNFDNAVAKVRETYAKKVSTSSIPTGKALGTGLSKQGLADAIVSHNTAKVKDYWKNDFDHARFQLEVLDTFLRARQAASDLVAFVRATKFTAAKSIESTAGGLYHQMQVVKNYINNPGAELIVVPSEDIDKALMDWENQDILEDDRKTYLAKVMENPFAFEQAMYDMTRLFTTKVLGKFFPYETSTFKTTRNDMTAMTRNDILSKKSIDEIHKDLVLYILSKIEGSALNPDFITTLDDGRKITQEEYYRVELPKLFEAKMEERKKQGKKPNAFLESIKVNQSKEGKLYLSITNVLERNVALKEARMQGWSELALSEDTDDNILAFDLFIYELYNTGFNVRSSSFAHLATAFVKSELPIFGNGSYSDFLRMLNEDQFKIDNEEFALLYILNHPDDYQFVYKPYADEQKDIVLLAKTPEGMYKDSFQVTMFKGDSNETTSYYSKVFLKVDRFQDDPNMCSATVIPAILVDNELYVMKEFAQSTGYYNHIEEMSIDEPITYVRMPILGKFGVKNYNPGMLQVEEKQSTDPIEQERPDIDENLSTVENQGPSPVQLKGFGKDSTMRPNYIPGFGQLPMEVVFSNEEKEELQKLVWIYLSNNQRRTLEEESLQDEALRDMGEIISGRMGNFESLNTSAEFEKGLLSMYKERIESLKSGQESFTSGDVLLDISKSEEEGGERFTLTYDHNLTGQEAILASILAAELHIAEIEHQIASRSFRQGFSESAREEVNAASNRVEELKAKGISLITRLNNKIKQESIEDALSNLDQYVQETVKTSDENGNPTKSCKF